MASDKENENLHYKDFLYNKNHNNFTERNVREKFEDVSFSVNTSHRIWLNEQTENYSEHWHHSLEIAVPLENYYDYYVKGEYYRLVPGDIFIVPPGELHSITAPGTGRRFIYMLNVAPISKLKGFAGIQALLSKPILLKKETHPKVYDDIYSFLLQIRNEYFSANEYADLYIESLLINLLIKLGENYNSDKELFPSVRLYKQKEYVIKFNQALEFIDTHYMDEVTLEDVADKIGFSKYHFSRLFKQYTGYTFCDYLTYRRIKIAEEYLASPDYSITEVAMLAGFSSISTFNRLFKQVKECTPSEFRSKSSFYCSKLLNAKERP